MPITKNRTAVRTMHFTHVPIVEDSGHASCAKRVFDMHVSTILMTDGCHIESSTPI
jgi:hypothetical protein